MVCCHQTIAGGRIFDSLLNYTSPQIAAFAGLVATFSAPPQTAFFANTLSAFISRC
jgi:hypothetical protein